MRGGRDERLRPPAAILETALHVLSKRGDASMGDIAAAAGVARATLYRYYPTREVLLQALASEALEQIAAKVADAGLSHAPVGQALERLFRAFLAVGDRYTAILRAHVKPNPDEAERLVGGPVLSVFQRGIDEGFLRDDFEVDVLMELFFSLGAAAIETGTQRTLGIEQTAASLASFFLDGARRRSDAPG